MNSAQPVIECLFEGFLAGDEKLLNQIESNRHAECGDIRAVVCTNNPSAVNLDLGLGISSNEYVVPIFSGPCAWFHSAGISLQTRLSNGQSIAMIDYSLGFDSNFAEKLRAVVFGENIAPIERDRVNGILMLKARNRNVQFDEFSFIIENTRLIRNNQGNFRPLETLTAFRMLDYLDWDFFKKSNGEIIFSRDRNALEAECRQRANKFLGQLQSDNEMFRIEIECMMAQALLLRLAKLWDQKPRSDARKILHELLRFSIQKLRVIPRTELRMIWDGISTKSGLSFFGPIFGKSKEILNKIRGMAWDITLLRNLERSITHKERGDFFIPYFVSLDGRLRELIRFSPIKSMLIDDAIQRAIPIRENELDFQVALQAIQEESDIREEMTQEKIEARRRLAKSISLNEIQNIIIDEEAYWMKV